MKLCRSTCLRAAAAALGLAALGASGLAQARDNVYWSLGVEAAPGVSVGLSNTRPVVVAPAPIIVAQPAPVYVAPAPVYVAPQPVYYTAAPVCYGPPGHCKHRWKHWKKHHRDWDD